MDKLGTLEMPILEFIKDHVKCDVLDFAVPIFTALGNAGIIWIITALVLLFFKKTRKCGILMGAGLILGVIFGNLILKNAIARPRPCWVNLNLPLLIENPTDFSFPSGHTLSSFVSAFVIFVHFKKAGVIALTVAALMGLSRLYLFVHYPSDVLFGAILGILIALLTCFVYRKLSLKYTNLPS